MKVWNKQICNLDQILTASSSTSPATLAAPADQRWRPVRIERHADLRLTTAAEGHPDPTLIIQPASDLALGRGCLRRAATAATFSRITSPANKSVYVFFYGRRFWEALETADGRDHRPRAR